jgi:tetratricopeptide (TPR) repeat protein
VKDQTHLWSQDYDYPVKDVLNIEDDLARAVAREIQLRLTSEQQADLSRSRPVNPEAFDAYMRGYCFFQRNTDKIQTWQRSILNGRPNLIPVTRWLGSGCLGHATGRPALGLCPLKDGHRLAHEAVERALALNPNLAEAHSQMSRLKRFVDFDWAGADESIRRAIALEPGNPEYLDQAAFAAAQFDRSDEALALARRAVELDPLNASSWGGAWRN